jgi:hypothetical protein
MTVGVGDESTVTWDKPGPGTWDLDASHVGPAPGPIIRRLFAETMPAGTAEGFRECGAPLARFDVGWVHGKSAATRQRGALSVCSLAISCSRDRRWRARSACP